MIPVDALAPFLDAIEESRSALLPGAARKVRKDPRRAAAAMRLDLFFEFVIEPAYW